MQFRNDELGATFEVPDDPDFDQIDKFDAALQAAFGSKSEMTDAQYTGLHLRIASEVGLIRNWQSTTRPGVPLSNIAKQDGRVVIWAGTAIRQFIRQIKVVDPKSCEPWSPTRVETERPLTD